MASKGEVLQFSAYSNRFVKKWRSASEASKALKIPEQNISKVINGKAKQARGYTWMLLSEYERRTQIFKR